MNREDRVMGDADAVAKVMTRDLHFVTPETSIMNAALRMRLADVGAVLVMEGEYLYGILTDRDIVVRAISSGRNPETTSAGAICSRDITTISPRASAGQAVRLMREKALRRLPVVDDETGRVIGILSIADIAIERDRRSLLGDISAAPGNV
jgi:CBS domain-containing protein